MSVLTVQIGQCGNQIGEKLFETIIDDCFHSKYVETIKTKNRTNQNKNTNLNRARSASSSNLSSKLASPEASQSKTFEDDTYKSVNQAQKLNKNYITDSIDRFFTYEQYQDEQELKNSADGTYTMYGRSVLIDMESKVVNKLLYNQPGSNKCKFREENSYTQKKGSGNNWSYGYCVNGPKSRDKIEDIMRKEVERCDRLASFLICMSMAGGNNFNKYFVYLQWLLLKSQTPIFLNN